MSREIREGRSESPPITQAQFLEDPAVVGRATQQFGKVIEVPVTIARVGQIRTGLQHHSTGQSRYAEGDGHLADDGHSLDVAREDRGRTRHSDRAATRESRRARLMIRHQHVDDGAVALSHPAMRGSASSMLAAKV